MSRVGQLYELQQIDSGLDSRVARLRQVDEQMGESEAVLAARAALQARRQELTSRQLALKQLTMDVDDASARGKSLEKKLYDGSIKNPKELASMQEEVAHLKTRVKHLEDQMLDAMMQSDEVENAAGRLAAELDHIEKEDRQFKDGLLEEKDRLVEQVKVLQVKRQRLIAEVNWGDLQAYERLRRGRGGTAVATVQNGLCSGCRTLVPAQLLRTARIGPELATCPNCGRVLYPVGEVRFKEFDHDLDNIDR